MSSFLLKASDYVSDCVSARTLLVGAGAATALYLARSLIRANQLPPGPWGLPILGRLPWLDASHFEEFEEQMRQQYGDIYSYRAGQRLMIVVSSYTMLKDMLKDELFSGRLLPLQAQEEAQGCGVVFTEGKTWSDQRRLSLRVLRDFGFAKLQSIGTINEEVQIVLDVIENNPKEIDTFRLFSALANSVIAALVFGRRFANDDRRFDQFLKDAVAVLDERFSSSLTLLFPSFTPLLRLMPREAGIKRAYQSIKDFLEEEIAKSESQLEDENAESLCLCDAYIQERRKAEARGDFEMFKPFQLVRVCLEMFVAGTDTTARSLEWLMVYMSVYPEVQAKVQQEIDDVVGRERRPQPSDRAELHYTQAVIDESLRLSAFAFNSIPHRAMRNTTFRGFRIPDDAVIVPFVFGAHRDASVWQRPDEFYPDHFLDSNGRYAASKFLIPFSVGKRACPGESLAMLELFMAFAAVMQRYSVQLSAQYQSQVPQILRGCTKSTRIAGQHRVDFVLR